MEWQDEAAGVFERPSWEECAPATFRLPGFGGRGLFLRACPFRGEDLETGAWQDVPGVDVGLLDTAQYVCGLTREATPGFSQRLSDFLLAAATGSGMVPPFHDEVLDLLCEVVSSAESEVELLVTFEQRRLSLRTSRAALAQGAWDVRRLEHVDALDYGGAEPPQDWS